MRNVKKSASALARCFHAFRRLRRWLIDEQPFVRVSQHKPGISP